MRTTRPPAHTPVVPAGMEELYETWHLAPAVRFGPFIVCSGVLGTGHDGRAAEDPTQQFELIFDNLAHVLAAAGAGLAHVSSW